MFAHTGQWLRQANLEQQIGQKWGAFVCETGGGGVKREGHGNPVWEGYTQNDI